MSGKMGVKPIVELFPPLSPDNTTTNAMSDITEHEGSCSQSQQLTDDFFDKIIHSQKKKTKRTKKEIEALSSFLSSSKLMHQLEEEEHTDPNDIVSIKNLCAHIIYLKKVKKGELVFRIYDEGDNCYFVIKGKFEALKIKQIQKTLSIDHYISYLKLLMHSKEEYLLSKVLEVNYAKLNIVSIDELNRIAIYYAKAKIRDNSYRDTFDLNDLKQIIADYSLSFKDFKVNESEVEAKYSTYGLKVNLNKKWAHYVSQTFKLTEEELISYERTPYLHEISLTTEETFTVMLYDKFLSFLPGDLFGYFSLELKEKRNASMRAEQDSVVGFLKGEDYLQLISPQQKKSKQKYIAFLLNFFFFQSISQVIFAKQFFHLFVMNDINANALIHKQNDCVTSLAFIAKGEVKVTISCSIVNIHNISKQIIDKLDEMRPQGISEVQLKELKSKYLQDQDIFRMRTKIGRLNVFSVEMNKKKSLKLYSLGENCIIGLEEAFLGMNYMTSHETGIEPVKCYSIDIDNLKTIFSKEQACVKTYSHVALNKILNFLMRLNELKRNLIEYSHYKNRNNQRSSENIFNGQNRLHLLKGLPGNSSSENVKTNHKKLQGTVVSKGIKEKIKSQLFRSSVANRLFKNERNSLVNRLNIHKDNTNSNSINNNNNETIVKEEISVPVENKPMKRIIKLKKTVLASGGNITNTFNSEVKKETYLTLDTLRRKPKFFKGVESPLKIDLTDPVNERMLSDHENTRVSMINLIGQEGTEEPNDEKDRLPLIQSLKSTQMNPSLMNKLNNYKVFSNSIHQLNQDELITNIEEVLETNLENDGKNVIANRIKHFYLNKKFMGYSYLQKSSYQKKNAHSFRKATK